MAPHTDPFYLVRDDIQASVNKAKELQTRLQGVSRSSQQYQSLRSEVEDECKSISWQVEEMQRTVSVAEKNPARFGLSQPEITSRRKWITQTKQEVEQMQRGLHQDNGKPVADRAGVNARLTAAATAEHDTSIQSEEQQQQQLIRQQDTDLDHLGEHVTRIGQVGLTIRDELDVQSHMLNELEQDTDETQTRLQAAQKKVDHLLRKAGLKGQLCIMVFLVVVLIVLLLLIFS